MYGHYYTILLYLCNMPLPEFKPQLFNFHDSMVPLHHCNISSHNLFMTRQILAPSIIPSATFLHWDGLRQSTPSISFSLFLSSISMMKSNVVRGFNVYYCRPLNQWLNFRGTLTPSPSDNFIDFLLQILQNHYRKPRWEKAVRDFYHKIQENPVKNN